MYVHNIFVCRMTRSPFLSSKILKAMSPYKRFFLFAANIFVQRYAFFVEIRGYSFIMGLKINPMLIGLKEKFK